MNQETNSFQSLEPEPWFGKIPDHWRVLRIANIFREVDRHPDPSLPVLSVSIHGGVSDKELTDNDRDRIVNLIEDRTKYQRVLPGDLVYNMMRAWQGAFGSVEVNGLVSPAYVVAEPHAEVRTKYIELLLRTEQAVEEVRRYSKGIADFRLRLYWEHFRNIRVCLPPIAEQDDVLHYIAFEKQRIDSLISRKKSFIELLREKKRSIIANILTNGNIDEIEKAFPGIHWANNLPCDWKSTPLKHLVTLRSGDAITSEDIRETGKFPVYGGNGLRGYTDRYNCDGDYILIGRQGALCGNVNYATDRFWASEHALIAYPRKGFNILWLGELLRMMDLGRHSTAAAQPGISAEIISNIRIPVPSLDEQDRISRIISSRSLEINNLIEKTNNSIDLLQEHKSALIGALVMGRVNINRTAKNNKDAAA